MRELRFKAGGDSCRGGSCTRPIEWDGLGSSGEGAPTRGARTEAGFWAMIFSRVDWTDFSWANCDWSVIRGRS